MHMNIETVMHSSIGDVTATTGTSTRRPVAIRALVVLLGTGCAAALAPAGANCER